MAAATPAVPIPAIPAVTGSIFLPMSVALLPTFPNASPTFSRERLLLFASSSSFLRESSVASISRFKARYCSSETSPFLNCSSTWASAVLRTSNFSLVSPTALASNFCFCSSASVFLGSNFSNFSTSLSSD